MGRLWNRRRGSRVRGCLCRCATGICSINCLLCRTLTRACVCLPQLILRCVARRWRCSLLGCGCRCRTLLLSRPLLLHCFVRSSCLGCAFIWRSGCYCLRHRGLALSCSSHRGSCLLPSSTAAAGDAGVALLAELSQRLRGVVLRHCTADGRRAHQKKCSKTFACKMHAPGRCHRSMATAVRPKYARHNALQTAARSTPVNARTSAGSSSPASCASRVHTTPGLTGETGRLPQAPLLPVPPAHRAEPTAASRPGCSTWARSAALAGLAGLLAGASAVSSTLQASHRCLLTRAAVSGWAEGGWEQCSNARGSLRGCGDSAAWLGVSSTPSCWI